jgi:hypothetical protein
LWTTVAEPELQPPHWQIRGGFPWIGNRGDVINGKHGQLEGKLQERYADAKDQTKKDTDDWCNVQRWVRSNASLEPRPFRHRRRALRLILGSRKLHFRLRGGQAHSEFGSSKLTGTLVAGRGCALSVARLRDWLKIKNPDSPATIEGVQPAGDTRINCVLLVDRFVCR